MGKESLGAYRCRVETTNYARDRFKICDNYHECVDGIVYVFAKDILDAASQIPNALEIVKVGAALSSPRAAISKAKGETT